MNLARVALVLVCAPLLVVFGCARAEKLPPPARPAPVPSLFNPASMRLHPTFTRVKNWSNPSADLNTAPDGIEAELEFSDRFGDAVKAEGTVTFELYNYRTDAADVRGTRITTPFFGSLMNEADQRARWNTATRTYGFRLQYPGLSRSKAYVLTATFDPKAGGRMFSRIILQPTPAVEP